MISFQMFCQIQLGEYPCVVIEEDISENEFINFSPNVNEMKYVTINIHFIQRADGTGNFTELDDGYGNPYTGYDVSFDIQNWMNSRWKAPLNIVPENNDPNLPYNVNFIIDAIYFHQSDQYYPNSASSGCHNTYIVNPSSLLQVYYRGDGYSDYANTVATTGLERYSGIKTLVNKYAVHANDPNDPIEWFWHAAGQTTMHELYHLLTLSHAVRKSGGPRCSDSDPNACNDYCDVTPTPYEMVNIYNYLPTNLQEPACGWQNGNIFWCSNNLMDYSGSGALSQCQVTRVHNALENGLKSYRLCTKLNTPITISQFAFPQIAYYGSNINIQVATGTPVVNSTNISNVYASNEVVFYEFEVKDGGQFEIFIHEACQ